MNKICYLSLCLLLSALQACEIKLGDFVATISQDDTARLIRVLAARTFRDLPARFDDIFIAKNGPGLLTSAQGEMAFFAFMVDGTILQQARNSTHVQLVRGNAQVVDKAADLVPFITLDNKEDNLEFDDLFSSECLKRVGDALCTRDLGGYKSPCYHIGQHLLVMHHQSTPLAAKLHEISQVHPQEDFSSILAKEVYTTRRADSGAQYLNNKIKAFGRSMSFYEDRNKPLVQDEEGPSDNDIRVLAMIMSNIAQTGSLRRASSNEPEDNGCPMQ